MDDSPSGGGHLVQEAQHVGDQPGVVEGDDVEADDGRLRRAVLAVRAERPGEPGLAGVAVDRPAEPASPGVAVAPT